MAAQIDEDISEWGKTYTQNYYGVETYSADVVLTRAIDYKSALIRNQKSASGWRPPSPYTRIVEHWTPRPQGRSEVSFKGRPEDWTLFHFNMGGNYAGKISLMEPDSNMESVAIIRALSKLKGQKVNLSVAFGERREAAEMMTNTVVGIARSVRRFRHTRPKDWLKVIKHETGHGDPKKIPESWLELQYGWKPLMQDVHGAVQALNNRERDADAYRATVRSHVKENTSREVRLQGPPYCWFYVPIVGMRACRVRLDYVLENPVLATLSQLGITNPAELVWELVPYSFVVDWFLPVGSYLSAFDAALGWSFKGGSMTRFSRHQGKAPALGYTEQNYYVGQDYSHEYTCNQMKMVRTVYSSSPLPRFPGLKNPLSTQHVANAMSLLVSAFRH